MKRLFVLCLCFLLLASGCGKTEKEVLSTEDDSISSAVTTKVDESVNEPEAFDNESDAFILFNSTDEFEDYILAGAYERFIADGVDVKAESVFLSHDLDEYVTRMLSDVYETFFCYTNEGEIRFINGKFSCRKIDNKISLNDCSYSNISDYLHMVNNNEAEETFGYYNLSYFFDFSFLKTRFGELIKYQNSIQAETLRTIMEEAGLTEDMPFISASFKAGDWNDYASPESATDKFIQELVSFDKTSLICAVRDGFVLVPFADGKNIVINTQVMGSAPNGTPLYGICQGGYYSELFEYRDKLYETTLADLEKASEVTINDVWNGSTDSEYFLINPIEGGDVELYALTNFEGYIIKDGDNLYPVYIFVDNNTPYRVVKADFDEDGTYEYGFELCRGRGTGYYVQGLVIVDPDEEDMVKLFDLDDLMLYNGNIFSHIKSEVDYDDSSISYWLEDDGKKTFEGKASLAEYASETFRPERLSFGDQFGIEYVDGKWRFTAGGGVIWSEAVPDQGGKTWYERPTPDFVYSIDLTGDIQYKNGHFTYENIKLSDLVFRK